MKKAIFALAVASIGASCSTPKPIPPPPDGSCCVRPDSSQGFSKVSTQPPYNASFLLDAEAVIGPVCGNSITESIQRLEDQLSVKAICSGPWQGGILVQRPDGLWEEWTVVKTDSGCWNVLVGDAYAGTWRGPALGCK